VNTRTPTMNANNVDLDAKTLRALSSPNRLFILQLLKLRNMNLTNLSRMLGLPKSSTYKNLTILIKSGLVIKEPTNNKWRYYKLTPKGAMLFSDKSKMVIISDNISKNSVRFTLEPNSIHASSKDPSNSE
jgi:DNA-binding transcriptional ArsR family regulator